MICKRLCSEWRIVTCRFTNVATTHLERADAQGFTGAQAPQGSRNADYFTAILALLASFTQNLSSSTRNLSKSSGDFDIDVSVPSRANAAFTSG